MGDSPNNKKGQYENKIDQPFGWLPQTIIEGNYDLSAKAVGILLYLNNRPDDWDYYKKDIAERFDDGESSISTGLKELREVGFLEVEKLRNDKGQISGQKWILKIPDPERGLSSTGKSSAGKSSTGKSTPNKNKRSKKESSKKENDTNSNELEQDGPKTHDYHEAPPDKPPSEYNSTDLIEYFGYLMYQKYDVPYIPKNWGKDGKNAKELINKYGPLTSARAIYWLVNIYGKKPQHFGWVFGSINQFIQWKQEKQEQEEYQDYLEKQGEIAEENIQQTEEEFGPDDDDLVDSSEILGGNS